MAISTPPGRGGIGIVRLSGSQALAISAKLLRVSLDPLPPRRATVGELLDEEMRTVDQVIVTFFPGPHSYTAEDIVEISCHGSPVILGFAVERALAEGARLARPGEFTERAFLNGRLDLAQAEAVRDLIEATTLYQARVALQQVEGALSRRLAPIKKQLCDLIALLEAGIDFAEDDLEVAPDEEILRRVAAVREPLERLADSFRYGKVVHGGVILAILGRPNVGKSSLFNPLLEREGAIVTAHPGTTRDQVSESVSIHGLPVRLIDTAGIRATSDVVEAKGVAKTYEALADADLVLVVIDLSQALEPTDQELLARVRRERQLGELGLASGGARSEGDQAPSHGHVLLVGNKADLPPKAQLSEPCLRVSAETGEGLEQLRQEIYNRAVPQSAEGQEAGFITNIRHEQLLRESQGHLTQAAEAVRAAVPHEMLLLDLYSALRPIDAITGATTVDDILENIFSTFCIGK